MARGDADRGAEMPGPAVLGRGRNPRERVLVSRITAEIETFELLKKTLDKLCNSDKLKTNNHKQSCYWFSWNTWRLVV